MIGKNTLKSYEYTSINQYFDYIVESQVNGNRSQVRELIKKLSKEQRIEFYNYLKINQIAFNLEGLFQ